jgi:hypothetical protein
MEKEREIEKCQRCGVDGEGDLRTLLHACFYAMEEMKLPFDKEVLFYADPKDLTKTKEPESIDVGGKKIILAPIKVKCSGELSPRALYSLRVCKDCRADWMHAIQKWFNEKPIEREVGSGIYVRDFGTSKEITREEWDRRNKE